MPLIEVTIAGRRRQVQCDDGEEPRLRRLAQYVDGKASEIARGNPELTEARLLLLTSLLVADELVDAYDELRRVRAALEEQGQLKASDEARAVDALAARIEQLAAALEKT